MADPDPDLGSLSMEEMRVLLEQSIATAKRAESLLRKTTLSEYIAGYHELVFAKFCVQSDPRKTTKGHMTNPAEKSCPTNLRVWGDFLETQARHLHRIYSNYPEGLRVFDNLNYLSTQGTHVEQHPIGDEQMLRGFMTAEVHRPLEHIIKELSQQAAIRTEFPRLGGHVGFENHFHKKVDILDELPLQREGKEAAASLPCSTPPSPSHSPSSSDTDQSRKTELPRTSLLLPDQLCVIDVGDQGQRRVAMVAEYKPPHKLTLGYLRLGLHDMNILTDVVNRQTKPSASDVEARYKYRAERVVAAAIVQTYSYMLEAGIEYAYLTTGQGFVFLKIDWEHPETLLYHLAEPQLEWDARDDKTEALHCTAINQLLAFALLALEAPSHGQEERLALAGKIKVWEKLDFATIWGEIPEEERNASPPASSYKGNPHLSYHRSPYFLRQKPLRKKTWCGPNSAPDLEDSDEDNEAPDDTPIRRKPQPPRNMALKATSSLSSSAAGDSGQGTRTDGRGGRRRYCSQKCLLGLVRYGRLDFACPNVAYHRKDGHWHDHHKVDPATFLMLLSSQLEQNLDRDLEPLSAKGSRGAMFQVTLSAYGYTLVAKGTISANAKHLYHEAAMYRRLERLQGVCVPVFLGLIDLKRPYYYEIGTRIRHMAFLSFAGQELDTVTEAATMPSKATLTEELIRSLAAVHSTGVLHADVRAPNALWNSEARRVFLIDFERANQVKNRYLVLLPVDNPGKRRFLSLDETKPSEKTKAVLRQVTADMKYEVFAAARVFDEEWTELINGSFNVSVNT